MESIEKRGDYTYSITISDGYDRSNKNISAKGSAPPDASLAPERKKIQRIAAVFEDDIKKENIIDSNITFEKFTQKWLVEHAEKRLERTTIEGYKMHLKTKILPAIGHIKLSNLKPLHLYKFYDSLTQDGIRLDGKSGGYSTRIIKYQHQIISSILQTAVYWQVIENNTAKRVRPPKGVDCRNKGNYFDENQIRDFLEYVSENEPFEYMAMAYTVTYSGIRKGEALGLLWEDIDFRNNTIYISRAMTRVSGEEFMKPPKNESSVRVVSLPSSVMALLKELKLKSTTARVFPFSYSAPTRWFRSVVKRYNEANDNPLPENVTFHGLRHTSATLLIAMGLDIKTISARLGHNDTTTTLNIYAHALKSKDKLASDMLEGLFSTNTNKRK